MRTEPPAVAPNYSEPLRTNPPRTPREPAGGTFSDEPRLPRTFEEEGTRANPTGTSNPMGTRPSPGAGDDPFRRARDADPGIDDREPLPGTRPGTTRPGSGLPARQPGSGAGADDRGMFGSDPPAGRRDSKKMESDPPTTVPKRDPGATDGTGRDYPNGTSRPRGGTISPIAKTPAAIASLDSKVTWRNVPERTRVKVRSGLAIPAVARTTNSAAPADPNSEWKPAGGATKIVRK